MLTSDDCFSGWRRQVMEEKEEDLEERTSHLDFLNEPSK